MSTNGSFKTDTLKDWSCLGDYQQQGWIYRGHDKKECPLETLLHRIVRQLHLDLNAAELEKVLMRDFKRHYHHYATWIPNVNDDLEWLSIMQHYGAPTRLLDFSYSIYVAAYFALEGALIRDEPRDCAIWLVNGGWLQTTSANKFPLGSKEREYIMARLEEMGEETFRSITSGAQPVVVMANPFRLNERLTIQRGLFCFPGDIQRPFEENLKALDGWDSKENVLRLDIPAKLRNTGIKILHYMGISQSTLFPGLDGYSRSLRHSMPLVLSGVHSWDKGIRDSVKV